MQSLTKPRRPVREGVEARCDTRHVVRERTQFWSALADDEGRATAISIPSNSLWLRCSDADLTATIDAILGNVFAHTPEGTPFDVTLIVAERGGAELVIVDYGAGWQTGQAVAERGVSGAGSIGLGLDIAARTAHASGGYLTIFARPDGGAGIAMYLGAPTD